MNRILSLFLFLSLSLSAKAQDCSVVLNHFLIVVDSVTYQSLLSSELVNSELAFAHEKTLSNWKGLYVIGEDNYIEIFHPKSIYDDSIPVGFSWISQSSLKANCLKNYKLPNNDFIEYDSDEIFDYLSLNTQDSSNLMTTHEMNKDQYESWTKKIYNDSLTFEAVDYNSIAESDSSKNYLFKNVSGLEIILNQRDSLSISQYLQLIGYTLEASKKSTLKFSNGTDFLTIKFSMDTRMATVNTIYFELRQSTASRTIYLGSSIINLNDKTGKWVINGNQ